MQYFKIKINNIVYIFKLRKGLGEMRHFDMDSPICANLYSTIKLRSSYWVARSYGNALFLTGGQFHITVCGYEMW